MVKRVHCLFSSLCHPERVRERQGGPDFFIMCVRETERHKPACSPPTHSHFAGSWLVRELCLFSNHFEMCHGCRGSQIKQKAALKASVPEKPRVSDRVALAIPGAPCRLPSLVTRSGDKQRLGAQPLQPPKVVNDEDVCVSTPSATRPPPVHHPSSTRPPPVRSSGTLPPDPPVLVPETN